VTALVSLASAIVAQAAEGEAHGLWDPKLKGYLVVISAVMLFCGSVYLLLWTNVGSSIGFLLAGAAVSGIVLMLSTLWVTSQFPNGYLGRQPKWKVEQVLAPNTGPEASDIGKIRTINANTAEAAQSVAGQIKADLDADISGPAATNKLYATADAYRAVKTYQVGGARKMPIWWSKKPEYAAVVTCTLTKAPTDLDQLNNPPFVPDCDPAIPTQTVVLHHDLGSLRQPAAFTMAGSAILCAGFLYGLYLVETRQRQAAATPPADAPVPATT
jgi:hypothetical protein